MEMLPWYKSAIVRQQVVALLLAVLTLTGLGAKLGAEFDVEQLVAGVFAFATVIIPAFTILTRLFKPTPPMTQMAAVKAEAMMEAAKPPTSQAPKEGGYVRPAMLAVLLVASTVAGCVGTKAAFQQAAQSPEAAADTAYVLAEQYSATLDQAKLIVENPATPQAVKAAIKQAELAATPVVLSLHGLRDSYVAVKSADNAAALQKAVNDAVLKVAALIRTIKAPVRSP